MSRRLPPRLPSISGETPSGTPPTRAGKEPVLPPPRHPALDPRDNTATSSALNNRPKLAPLESVDTETSEPGVESTEVDVDPEIQGGQAQADAEVGPSKVVTSPVSAAESVGEGGVGAKHEEELGHAVPGQWRSSRTKDEDEELRRQLEDEEIERYLKAFGKHVHHLRVQPERPPPKSFFSSNPSSKPSPAPAPLEPFTIARLRSNAERLYVVAAPAYSGFFSNLGSICMWTNPTHTALCAIIYFTLVFCSLLIPGLATIPLLLLLRRKVWPPSLVDEYRASQEVQARAEEAHEVMDEIVDEAQEAGEESGSDAAGAGAGIGVRIDLGRAKEMGESVGVGMGPTSQGKKKRKSVRSKIAKIEEDYGAIVVHVLGDIADMHEKVKNLYLWRDPKASTSASIVLSLVVVVLYLIPAWLMVKTAEVGLGAVAFVVVPIVARMEGYEPMAWMAGPAPTDAEYAMGLIRRRAESGQPLISQPRPSRRATAMSEKSVLSLTNTASTPTDVVSLRSSPGTPTTPLSAGGTGWTRVKRFGESSGRWLENTRQIVTGEKEVSVSIAEDVVRRQQPTASIEGVTDTALVPASTAPGPIVPGAGESGPGLPKGVESIMTLRWGSKGPGLVFTQKDKSEGKPVSYFAQYGATPGSLILSSDKIVFNPLIPSKEKAAAAVQGLKESVGAVVALGPTMVEGPPLPSTQRRVAGIPESEGKGQEGGVEGAVGTTTESKFTKSVEIEMKDVVGIRKRDKVSLLVVIAAGLEIEVVNGQRVVFAIVSNRDEAFHRLLALSNKSFAKV